MSRSIGKDLYWCRVPENSWSRTILHEKTHWRVLAICRASDMSWVFVTTRRPTRKVGFNGTPKLDPFGSHNPVTCKVNMEWKSELNLLTKTILTRGWELLMAWTNWSQTWSTGSTTTTSRRPPQRRRNFFAVASRSKAKAKPRRPSTASSSSKIAPILERIWIDIEPGAEFDQAYPVAKRINTLFRHGELPREEDGAIEFWRLKMIFGTDLSNSQYWSDDVWKSKMAGDGGNKTRFQCCTDSSGQEILHLRALQGHPGRDPTDPSLQDNVLIPENFIEYIYHIGCAVNSHSTNSGLIPGGQNSSKDRQTVFFTAVNPMHKNHQDPIELDLTKPRLASNITRKSGKGIKIRCTGPIFSLLNVKD